MAHIGSRRTWTTLYADLERASKGIEYWSALRFMLWGVYFTIADVYSGPSDVLNLLTTQPWGGIFLIVCSILWLAALTEHRTLPYTVILLIRKTGCIITLVLTASTGFAVAAALMTGALLPGGLISPLSLVPIALLTLVALARPRRQYRAVV